MQSCPDISFDVPTRNGDYPLHIACTGRPSKRFDLVKAAPMIVYLCSRPEVDVNVQDKVVVKYSALISLVLTVVILSADKQDCIFCFLLNLKWKRVTHY